MLLIIIWYFFIIIFGLGLVLNLQKLASASRFWPRLTSLLYRPCVNMLSVDWPKRFDGNNPTVK